MQILSSRPAWYTQRSPVSKTKEKSKQSVVGKVPGPRLVLEAREEVVSGRTARSVVTKIPCPKITSPTQSQEWA